MNKLLNLSALIALLLIALPTQAATVVIKISAFPNTATLADSDLFLISKAGTTNKNINWGQFRAIMETYFPSTQNIYVTQTNFTLYSTNLYVSNSTVSNYFSTNVFNNTYMSNFFQTNQITTNIFAPVTITNVTVQDSFASNFFNTNIYQNSYASNYFTTNNYLFTTNLFTTNINYNITNVDYFISTNAYISFLTNNYFYSTNITAQKITVNNIYSSDSTATNGFYIGTNYWAGPTNTLDMRNQDQYYRTYTPLSVTGLINRSNTVVEGVILTITNAASTNVTMYFPAGITPTNLLGGTVITNATTSIFSIRYSPLAGTNAVPRSFGG